MKKFDTELELAVNIVKQHCDREDKSKYQEVTALLRRNELWFHGNQQIYWNFANGDWATPPSLSPFFNGTNDERGMDDCYDYVINILKANGNSFISALSAQIPTTIFPPADTNNENDIATASAYNKISELIDNYNPINYLFMKLIFIKYIQGTVAIYTYPDSDKKYGTYQVPQYNKNTNGQHEYQGQIEVPKTRVLFDILGSINCKFPYSTKNQADMGYLQSYSDQHYALMQDIYDDDLGEIKPRQGSEGKFDRAPTSYLIGLEPNVSPNLVTVTRTWIRPWMYRIIQEKSPQLYKDMKKDYPTGLYSVHVEKKLCELLDQDLDSRWTLSRSGTTSHSLSDPACQPLLHIQEMKNTIANLSIDIIEHGIPETFADPDVLDFDQYGQNETKPGMITKTKGTRPGMRNIGEAFFTLPKTQLNPSIAGFNATLDQEAQFVFGNNPAIFGGSLGNRVPGEVYEQSRAQGLKQWGLDWNEIVDVWKRAKMKAVKIFVEYMADKEQFTKQQSNGRPITVYIERHELQGKIGDTEPQVSEAFPMTAEQKKAWLMQLIGLQSPVIESFLTDPSNREAVADLLSFPELKVPGANQVLKQLIEYSQLSNSVPVGPNQSSVPIDFDVDDHTVHANIIRNLLADEPGIDLKEKNPQAYLNCLYHLKAHLVAEQSQMQRPYGSSVPGVKSDSTAISAH